MQGVYLIRDLQSEYKNSLKSSKTENVVTQFGCRQNTWTDASPNKDTKRCSKLLVIGEMHINTSNTY